MTGPLLIPALIFFAIGAALIAWPHKAIALYVKILKPMRSIFGSVVEWEIRLLQGRVAPILVRLFGAFAIVASFAIIFYATGAAR
ncbi:MAG TPA: hypothetical protein VLK25_13235 [Allosphingosinicella sp.]|nr:hypothetical protein [Allosphingosinicella sp.]